MVYFLVLVVFVKVLVVFSEIGVVLVVFGSGGSETLNPTLVNTHAKFNRADCWLSAKSFKLHSEV